MICRKFSHDCRHLLRCDVRRGYSHGCHHLVVAMVHAQVLRLHPPISHPTRQSHMNALNIHPFFYFPTCEYLPLITPTPRYAKLQCLFSIRRLQIVLLLRGPRVLVQSPLNITILVLQRSATDLETAHRHSWSDLCQLHALVSSLHKDVVAHFDRILDVLERHNSASKLGSVRNGVARWEDVLEDLDNALAEIGGEALKDEVWVGF